MTARASRMAWVGADSFRMFAVLANLVLVCAYTPSATLSSTSHKLQDGAHAGEGSSTNRGGAVLMRRDSAVHRQAIEVDVRAHMAQLGGGSGAAFSEASNDSHNTTTVTHNDGSTHTHHDETVDDPSTHQGSSEHHTTHSTVVNGVTRTSRVSSDSANNTGNGTNETVSPSPSPSPSPSLSERASLAAMTPSDATTATSLTPSPSPTPVPSPSPTPLPAGGEAAEKENARSSQVTGSGGGGEHGNGTTSDTTTNFNSTSDTATTNSNGHTNHTWNTTENTDSITTLINKGPAMLLRDPAKDGMKCGAGSRDSNRLFYLRSAAATTEGCGQKCNLDGACVSWSGVEGAWCAGCKVPLNTDHHTPTVAYEKHYESLNETQGR